MNAPEAVRWLAYARSDLNAARALLRDPEYFPRQVCFLAQQAAEKAIKAVFVLLDIEFPFTHDLDHLRDLLPEGWRVKTEFPDLAELTVWAVEARYPGDLPDVVEADVRQSLRTAEAVYDTIEQDMRPFETQGGAVLPH
jgi:HEPN domain-containing protein